MDVSCARDRLFLHRNSIVTLVLAEKHIRSRIGRDESRITASDLQKAGICEHCYSNWSLDKVKQWLYLYKIAKRQHNCGMITEKVAREYARQFRADVYVTFQKRADAVFELIDALPCLTCCHIGIGVKWKQVKRQEE